MLGTLGLSVVIMRLLPVGGSPEHAGFPCTLEFKLVPEVSLASCMHAQLGGFPGGREFTLLPSFSCFPCMHALFAGDPVNARIHAVVIVHSRPMHACTVCGGFP